MLGVMENLYFNADIVLKEFADDWYALDINTGDSYKLNDSSFFILENFQKGLNFEKVLDNLIKEYRISYDMAYKDCQSFVRNCLKTGILKIKRGERL